MANVFWSPAIFKMLMVLFDVFSMKAEVMVLMVKLVLVAMVLAVSGYNVV